MGKSNDTSLYDSIIGYFYYIFYLGEKSIYTCCSDQTDVKFKINEILPCLERKNINIKCIEDKIVTNSEYYISDSNLIEI